MCPYAHDSTHVQPRAPLPYYYYYYYYYYFQFHHFAHGEFVGRDQPCAISVLLDPEYRASSTLPMCQSRITVHGMMFCMGQIVKAFMNWSIGALGSPNAQQLIMTSVSCDCMRVILNYWWCTSAEPCGTVSGQLLSYT